MIMFLSSTRDDLCQCGYPKSVHVDGAIKPEGSTGESWDKHRHVHEFPTDAFGDISFCGLRQKTSKVRQYFVFTATLYINCM